MKKILLILGLGIATLTASAQGEFSTGADLVSSYVWRGSQADNNPNIQPTVEYSVGSLAIGAWGSYGLSSRFQEADLYASYGFDFGLSLGLTDYYYPGNSWLQLENNDDEGKVSSHGIEINAGYETGAFSIAANYALYEGAGLESGTMYFEAGYAFENFNVFIGGGDGWHVLGEIDPLTGERLTGKTGDFQICNIGIGTSYNFV